MSPEENKEWKQLIDRDIRQLQIKDIRRKASQPHHLRRFNSVDESLSKKYSKTPSVVTTPSASPACSPNKTRSNKKNNNMSLLFVLTHKRSNSHNPLSRNHLACQSTKTMEQAIRKSSIHGNNKITLKSQEKERISIKDNYLDSYVDKRSK